MDAICSGNVAVETTPPGTKTRCSLIIDLTGQPDYLVKRNLKRDDAAEAVALIRQFLEWD